MSTGSGAPLAHTGADDSSSDASSVGPAAASVHEVLRGKDFSRCTPEELMLLRGLVASLALVAPRRRSRRTVVHPLGRRVDLRATLQRARHTGGDPVRLVRRRRRDRPRRVVLIADVSGSMDAYARAYLYLLHGAVRALPAEAFVFSTRLTRLTRVLSTTDPDVALTHAMAEAPDWAGGTRIGAAIKAFNDGWGRRGLARRAVVVIVSDGWEGEDAALLGREMARLSRLAHRIIWVNPRKQHRSYRPVVAGMAAALPYVDEFVSGHSLDGLSEVIDAIASAA
jgi:uncharacterized protein